MERTGEVIAVKGDELLIRFCRPTDCEKCHGCMGGAAQRELKVRGQAQVGDAVRFTDGAGTTFSYVVSEIQQLPGTAIEEMAAGDWDLTLFTCTLGGQARLTLRCTQVGA